jgi:hypothetical protein
MFNNTLDNEPRRCSSDDDDVDGNVVSDIVEAMEIRQRALIDVNDEKATIK